jgi:hypothetical protein
MSKLIKTRNTFLAGVILLCGTAVSARADIVFTFNSLSPGTGDSSNEAAIETYMDGLLGCVGCVTVTGAATDKTYNGDNHVVGNNGKSLTLGTSDGATNNSTLTPSTTYDTFLSNITNVAGQHNNQTQSISSEIIITFSKPVDITGFDYEIFPDASCPKPNTQYKTNCPSLPGFTFDVNGSTQVFQQNAVFPSSSGTNGTSTQSPNSGTCTWCKEQAAQYIGTWSGNISGVTELDFIDWPAGIGVDNIKLGTSTVPEPRGGAILLGALLLAGLAGKKLLGFARSSHLGSVS